MYLATNIDNLTYSDILPLVKLLLATLCFVFVFFLFVAAFADTDCCCYNECCCCCCCCCCCNTVVADAWSDGRGRKGWKESWQIGDREKDKKGDWEILVHFNIDLNQSKALFLIWIHAKQVLISTVGMFESIDNAFMCTNIPFSTDTIWIKFAPARTCLITFLML